MFPEPSDADHTRSVITLTQIDTFLTLVEEGGVARAADCLGVGRSTVSAHAKVVAEEVGQQHFRRHNGGLIVTEAGLDAYNRLRPLMARAAFCMRYFCSRRAATPTFVPILLPSGFPGSVIDRAFGRAAARLAATQPAICPVPTYVGDSVADTVGLSYVASDAGIGTLRDRWLVIGARTRTDCRHAPVGLGELAGIKMYAPGLPFTLHPALSALAQQAEASLEWSDAGIQEILGLVAQSPKLCAIVPAGLFNPALAGDQFECALVESTRLDPAIAIGAARFPAIEALLKDELRALAVDRAVLPAARMPQPCEVEALSLKHCRSFLALYEEGNVGRAAQRLSIVQPALTVQLHRIEEQVGCSLFDRSCHGLRANEQADKLYGLVGPLIADFNATLRHLRASGGKRMAPIRVGLIPALDDESLMSEGFAMALDKWSRTYPNDVLQVMEGYSGTLMRWLQSGMIDFALVDRVFTDSRLVQEAVVEDKMAVVVASGSDLLPPGAVKLQQLAHMPLVLPSSRHGLRNLLAQTLCGTGVILQPRLEVDSMAGCLNMVKLARYATILPMGSVYKSRSRRGLSVHEITDPQILRTICLARVRNRPCGEAGMNLLEELRLAFAGPAEPPASRAAPLSHTPVKIIPPPLYGGGGPIGPEGDRTKRFDRVPLRPAGTSPIAPQKAL